MEYGKVSIIIPTYNRFRYLMNAIESVKKQTYKNIEIIVINDCSTQLEYYNYNWESVIILNLKENSKKTIGFSCAAHVRNQGILISTGKYIAFCDDDDIWFPNKLEIQLKTMQETGCKMSCTDGLIGIGMYDKNEVYKKYNSEYYYDTLQNIYKQKGSNLLENGFPDIWDLNFLKIHNCVVCSSVIVEKDILNYINNMKMLNSGEDYRCWLDVLEHTNIAYIKDICFYYDAGHGDGQNY